MKAIDLAPCAQSSLASLGHNASVRRVCCCGTVYSVCDQCPSRGEVCPGCRHRAVLAQIAAGEVVFPETLGGPGVGQPATAVGGGCPDPDGDQAGELAHVDQAAMLDHSTPLWYNPGESHNSPDSLTIFSIFTAMAGKQRFTTEHVIAAIVQHKGLLYLTAKHLQCTYRTVKNYVERYPTVREALDNARGELIDTAEMKLYESIQKGEAWGITLCLKTLGRDRGYVERTETKHEDEYGVGLAQLLEARQALKTKLDALAQKVRENGEAHDR